MTSEDLNEILASLRRAGAEPTAVEVKNGTGGVPKSLVETLVAFSNRDGGTIIFGVDEASEFAVVGLKATKAYRDGVIALSRDAVTPALQIDADFIEVEGAMVLVIDVPSAPADQRPVYVTSRGVINGAFLRTGDGDRRMSEGEIALMVSSRSQPVYDREPVPGSSVDDLDKAAVAKTLERVRSGSTSLRKVDDRTALTRLGVMSRSHPGQLTLGGLLAFGEFPQEWFPQLMVSFVVHSAESDRDTRFLDNVTVRGSIPEMVNEVLAAIRRNLSVRAVVTETGRTDRLDFPMLAIREAVVNALLHRDYSPTTRGSQVQIELHPERLVIRSPGGLYGGVTTEDLGESGVSSSRNAVLASLLSEAFLPRSDQVLAENRASGVPAMFVAARASGLPPPVFESRVTSFEVTLSRSELLGPQTRRWLASLALDLPTPVHEIALAMMRTDHVTNAALREWGADRIEAGRVLRDLVDSGLGVRQGGRRFARYVLDPSMGAAPSQPPLYEVVDEVAVHESKASVRAYIQRAGTASAADVEGAVGLKRGAVVRWLNELVDDGDVVAVGVPRSRGRRYAWAGRPAPDR